jgi:L-fuculose-phosphate aldolase
LRLLPAGKIKLREDVFTTAPVGSNVMRRDKILKEEIIKTGRNLARAHLIVSRAGNLSARLDKNNILITATGAALGDLSCRDIIRVDLSGKLPAKGKRPSSELPLHSLIYKNFAAKTVIHCHPPLTNAYFAVYRCLTALTFETDFYLGRVPVVEQGTLTVTRPHSVIQALKKNKLVVVKNHGVFSLGENFCQALERIELLEEAIRVAAVARLFKKKALDKLDRGIKKSLACKKIP